MDPLVYVATSVDFNFPLQEFGPDSDTLLKLIAICDRGSWQSKFHFVSSTASAGLWNVKDNTRSVTPEPILHEASTLPSWAYG